MILNLLDRLCVYIKCRRSIASEHLDCSSPLYSTPLSNEISKIRLRIEGFFLAQLEHISTKDLMSDEFIGGAFT